MVSRSCWAGGVIKGCDCFCRRLVREHGLVVDDAVAAAAERAEAKAAEAKQRRLSVATASARARGERSTSAPSGSTDGAASVPHTRKLTAWHVKAAFSSAKMIYKNPLETHWDTRLSFVDFLEVTSRTKGMMVVSNDGDGTVE